MKHSTLLIAFVLCLATGVAVHLAKRPEKESAPAGTGAEVAGKADHRQAPAVENGIGVSTAVAGKHSSLASSPAATAGPNDEAKRSATTVKEGRVSVGQGPGWGTSVAAGAVASESRMLFLCLKLKGQKIELVSQSVVDGTMKLPPDVVPEAGIYHRVVSSSGQVLAQGITPDPAVVHWDSPVEGGGGLLTGGKVRLENVDFALRYPAIQGMDHIQFFGVSATDDVSRLDAKGSKYYGSFKLAVVP